MPPELAVPEPWRSLLDLGLFGFAIWVIRQLTTRAWITRETYDEERADDEKRLTYVEARRIEEKLRADRAEEKVVALSARWDRAIELLVSIDRENIRIATQLAAKAAQLREAGDQP